VNLLPYLQTAELDYSSHSILLNPDAPLIPCFSLHPTLNHVSIDRFSSDVFDRPLTKVPREADQNVTVNIGVLTIRKVTEQEAAVWESLTALGVSVRMLNVFKMAGNHGGAFNRALHWSAFTFHDLTALQTSQPFFPGDPAPGTFDKFIQRHPKLLSAKFNGVEMVRDWQSLDLLAPVFRAGRGSCWEVLSVTLNRLHVGEPLLCTGLEVRLLSRETSGLSFYSGIFPDLDSLKVDMTGLHLTTYAYGDGTGRPLMVRILYSIIQI